MFDWILQLDRHIFELINIKLTHPLLDVFFNYITNLHHRTLIVTVLCPLLLAWWVYKQRAKALKVIVHIVVVAGLSDAICYHGIKNFVKRVRPNNNEAIESVLRVGYGPKSPSFPSNHASTSFAIAATASYFYPVAAPYLFLTAVLVGYSRVYVGVHYVSDILGGAVIGILISFLYLKFIKIILATYRKKKVSKTDSLA